MDALFLKIVNMSIAASWLILAVILLRVILKKAPKWVNVLLWGIVAIRLICPFSFESALSLIPSNETIPLDIGMDTTPAINSGINAINNAVNPIISQSNTPAVGASVNPLQVTIGIYESIWIMGIVVMLIYATVSYFRLQKKVGASLYLRDKIWICDDIQTPFILGAIKPRIYIPSGTDDAQLPHIIAHENAHLKRRDHWWKPLGFLVLAIHWFNPLVWVAYILLCRDIESACDEKVIRELNQSESISYSEALLACSVNRRMVMVCPLAFGEVSVKERVNRVLNYKKPTFWIIVTALLVCIGVAVCFLTDPKQANSPQYLSEEDYGIFISAEDVTSSGLTLVFHNPLLPPESITAGRFFTIQTFQDGNWEDLETKTEAIFPSDSFVPNANTWSVDVNWEWLYGQLPAGKYRICTDVCVSINSTGVSISEHMEEYLDIWVEFEIQNDNLIENAFEMNLAGNMSLQNKMILSAEHPYWCIHISNEGSSDITVEVNGNVYEVKAGSSDQIVSEGAWKAGTYSVSFASIHGMYGKAICEVSTNPFVKENTVSTVDLTQGNLTTKVEDVGNYIYSVHFARAMRKADEVATDEGLKESLIRYAIESGAIVERVYQKEMEPIIEDMKRYLDGLLHIYDEGRTNVKIGDIHRIKYDARKRLESAED